MAYYRYEAIDRAGKTVLGTMDAGTESEVNSRLDQMGFSPRSIVAASGAVQRPSPTARTKTSPTPRPKESASPKELSLFFRQFAALVRSGISLYQALENLGPRTGNAALSEAASQMADTAHRGGKVSDVMSQYPKLFAPHVISGVRAGELGGYIEIVLDEIAFDYEQDEAFYRGMWLPKSLLIQAVLSIAIAQPLFPTLFPNAEFQRYVVLVVFRNLPIVGALYLLWRLFLAWMGQPARRTRRDELILKVPAFGDMARQKSLFTFVRALRRLYAAGIGPMNAWEGAMNMAPNAVIRGKLGTAYDSLQKGVPLHDAFRATGLFANETEQLLATGMVSGHVVDMLDRVADYYQNSLERAFELAKHWMKRTCSVLLILLVGALLIMMMSSYFTGIFNSDLVKPE